MVLCGFSIVVCDKMGVAHRSPNDGWERVQQWVDGQITDGSGRDGSMQSENNSGPSTRRHLVNSDLC